MPPRARRDERERERSPRTETGDRINRGGFARWRWSGARARDGRRASLERLGFSSPPSFLRASPVAARATRAARPHARRRRNDRGAMTHSGWLCTTHARNPTGRRRQYGRQALRNVLVPLRRPVHGPVLVQGLGQPLGRREEERLERLLRNGRKGCVEERTRSSLTVGREGGRRGASPSSRRGRLARARRARERRRPARRRSGRGAEADTAPPT